MEVKQVCILGAGEMGRQLTQAFATAGFGVAMYDVADAIVETAHGAIKGNLQRFFVDKGKMTQEQANEIVGRIKPTANFEEAAKGADLVIEAIPEKMDLKKETFDKLAKICRADTILASNTSALSITEMASAASNPERVIGMHFFNPVPLMRFVEIVKAPKTSEETIQTIKEISEKKLGKETVVVKDSAGFITSRMVTVISNEAALMLEEGIASAEDIDKACKLALGHPMGPLEVQDYTSGLGVCWEVLTYMEESFKNSKYHPADILTEHVKAGHLGRKTGKGFHDPCK